MKKTHSIMKRLFLIFFVLLMINDAFSQKSIVLNFKDGEIELNANKLKFKKDEYYKFTINNINTAHHYFKIESKSYEIHSPIPDVLKPIIPGIAASFRSLKKDSVNYDLIAKSKMDRLVKLKSLADLLHDKTKNNSNNVEAHKALSQVFNTYGNPSNNDELIDKVSEDIYHVFAALEIIKSIVDNGKVYDSELITSLALAQLRAEELKKNNYLSYLDYIIKSTKSVSSKDSKSVKSQKDLTEVRILLVDLYSKDTLYDAKETIYNYRGWGLSFSTGFFYSNLTYDQKYYLQPRDDGNLSVKKNIKNYNDVSIGGFALLYYKTNPSLRIGAGMGLSVSPFDGKSRYLLGIGTLIGKEKMIGLNAGVAWSQVKELSAVINEDSNGKYLSNTYTDVPVFEKIKSGFFFGITYNISSVWK